MKETDHLVHPKHCFCQIPEAELRPWVVKRYREHHGTIELLNSTPDAHEKEIISIVAMLDLDEETVLHLMGDVEKPTHHILHCRENVKRILGLDRSSG